VRLRSIFAFIVMAATAFAADPTPPKLKEQMRTPWTRSEERFIRHWLALGDIPLGDSFDKDWLVEHGGETAIKPVEKMTHQLPNGSTIKWRSLTAWGDATDLSEGPGLKRDLVAYAFTNVPRKEAGKALLCIGSDESIRVWLNGVQVLDRRTPRQLTFDEDLIEVDMKQGDNSLLIKLEQRKGPWVFSARVLERGAIPPRVQEIGPSLMESAPKGLVIRTDINKDHSTQDLVTVLAVGAGGKVFAEASAPRGETVRFDPSSWPDGAYELRCSTRRLNGLLYVTHIPYYKGDAIAAARILVAAAAASDTNKMLADLVIDRLGQDYSSVTGNPWWAIHAPLMEFEELKLEAAGKTARVRPYGFYRFSYRDDVDGSPQFCRAYLPGGYDPAKKWPLVIRIHGYNPANPDYVRWWSVDTRHNIADVEYAGRQGVIYMEPHGRGNTTYLGLGDQDIQRVIQLAKQQFSVDEDRVYLVGESMGGWGTWNVGTRHPDLFAAIAPVYGGSDYHSELTEEQLAKLNPTDRFLEEKGSSWSMADGLLNMPILVHHGDVDQSVNVDFSRYGVRMLQRWGYNVRYVEMPGYGHEELNVMANIIDWLLQYRREANPAHVRLRSAELQNAKAYWAAVDQAARPNEFMVVDAEVTAPNTIRVDSQNVLALTLSPGAILIDPSRDVKVVWNGDARTAKMNNGRLKLAAPGYERSPLEKTSKVAGPLGDIYNTPFAIVTGTASADPAMNDLCRRKAEQTVNFWKQWQRQPPRVFKDSELSDADAAKYSLILIGGPEANLVTRKLAAKLPVEIAADHIKVGSKTFAASDARLQMIYPSPLNPERYVLLVAATSPGGLYFWMPDRIRNAELDFIIEDDHMPGGKDRPFMPDLWVASGWFDQRWQTQDSLVLAGNDVVRSKALALHAPDPNRPVDPKALDSLVGGYQIAPGMVIKVQRQGSRLIALVGEQPALELVPVSDVEFFVVEGPVKLVFEKDAAGKAVAFKGWQNGQEFTAKKVE
jgi:hypothetical protein